MCGSLIVWVYEKTVIWVYTCSNLINIITDFCNFSIKFAFFLFYIHILYLIFLCHSFTQQTNKMTDPIKGYGGAPRRLTFMWLPDGSHILTITTLRSCRNFASINTLTSFFFFNLTPINVAFFFFSVYGNFVNSKSNCFLLTRQ